MPDYNLSCCTYMPYMPSMPSMSIEQGKYLLVLISMILSYDIEEKTNTKYITLWLKNSKYFLF